MGRKIFFTCSHLSLKCDVVPWLHAKLEALDPLYPWFKVSCNRWLEKNGLIDLNDFYSAVLILLYYTFSILLYFQLFRIFFKSFISCLESFCLRKRWKEQRKKLFQKLCRAVVSQEEDSRSKHPSTLSLLAGVMGNEVQPYLEDHHFVLIDNMEMNRTVIERALTIIEPQRHYIRCSAKAKLILLQIRILIKLLK